MAIRLVLGDITRFPCDAIVNAANRSLLGGGGVDGAIHRVGGPTILEQCRELRRTTLPDGLEIGRAVATSAGRLPARWVIHTVGPIYHGRSRDPELLRSAYRSSLALGRQLGARSIAFPSISTGAYGYPTHLAAPIALAAVSAADPPGQEAVRAQAGGEIASAAGGVVGGSESLTVTFVLFGSDTLEAFTSAAAEMGIEVATGG